MERIRVFAGVPLPVETRLALADRLADFDVPGKVAPPENWHLTLRFLGRVDQVTLERFLSGLIHLSAEPAFQVALGGFGAFPNARRAAVVWLGLRRGEEALARLNQITEEAAVAAGLAPEERPFHPHLTLARVRPPADVRVLLDDEIPLGWECDRIVIYQSHLGGGPARYEALETFALAR